MAKGANSYKKAPWVMKQGEFEEFTAITPENLKNAKVLGRVFYIIAKDGKLIEYCGSFFIAPQMQKGMLRIEGHPFIEFKKDIYMEDESLESYMQYGKVINHLVEKRNLYIKISDPIVKFLKV